MLNSFNRTIENHKEEFKKGYKAQLEEFKRDFEVKKKLIEEQIVTLDQSRLEKEDVLNSLKNEIESITQKIENLNQNKERILADFSIIKDVLSISDNSQKTPKDEDSL